MSRANTTDLVAASALVERDYPNLFLPDKLWQIEARSEDGASTRWLAYVLTSPRSRAAFSAAATGSSASMKNISQSAFLAVRTSVPPLLEQRKIACILGTWDEALAQMDALIAAKEQRLKGLAQCLLTGEERLPGFSKEWKPQKLGRYFNHFSKRNRDGESITVLSCSKVHGIVPQAELFGKRIASDDTSNYKVVSHGDLVYDPMLLWDASIGFVEAVERGVISPAYASFKLKEKMADRSFFKYFFDGHYMGHQYKVISQGTNRRRRKAMASDFLKIEALLPEKDEQVAIASVLNTAEVEVDLLHQERTAMAAQKKGLMQRLLTGEVRVKPDVEDHANRTS